jgi:hypothetical protein
MFLLVLVLVLAIGLRQRERGHINVYDFYCRSGERISKSSIFWAAGDGDSPGTFGSGGKGVPGQLAFCLSSTRSACEESLSLCLTSQGSAGGNDIL